MSCVINVNRAPKVIFIGNETENDARRISFDLSAWVEEFGAGTAQLLIKRPGETEAYSVLLTLNNGKADWLPSSTDTAIAGTAEISLAYSVGSVAIRTGIIFAVIDASIATGATPPPGLESWVAQLGQLAEDAQTAADDAEAAKDDAEAAAASVEGELQQIEQNKEDISALKSESYNLIDPTGITPYQSTSAADLTRTGFVIRNTTAAMYSRGYLYLTLKPNTEYTFSAKKHTTSGVAFVGYSEAPAEGEPFPSANISLISRTAPDDETITKTFTTTTGILVIRFYAAWDTAELGEVEYSEIMVFEGTEAKPFVRHVFAQDDEARNQIEAAEEKLTELDDLSEEVDDLKNAITQLGNNTTVGLFGAKWDRLTNKLTRLNGAKDITTDTTNFCHKGTINANYDNPFDNIYPWSEMYQCDVDLTKYRSGNYTLKECVTAVYGDPDFTYEGSNTNFVGRYRPEFWYKSEEDEDGNVSYYVSQIEREGFKHASEAIDGISFVIDAGNNNVTAGAGIPLTNIAVSQIHSRARTSGFTLQDIGDIDAIVILYLVEYANWNSQNALGDGCASCFREAEADVISNVTVGNGETTFDVNDSALAQYMQVGAQIDIGATLGAVMYRGLLKSYSVSGTTYTITLDRELAVTNGMIMSVHGFSACEFDMIGQSLGNASGYLGTNGKANVWYRGGIIYANRYQYVLGIYRQTGTGHLWVCPDGVNPDDYDGLNTSVHHDTGISLAVLETAAWVTVGGNAQRIPGLAAFMAADTPSGNSVSPVGDQQYVPLPTTGNTILLFGCAAINGWPCGVLGGNWNVGAGDSYWSSAGRPILKKSL